MKSRGFTLIEVLVALVIVAVGMSVLMGALTSSAKTVSYMQDKSFAEWVALNQISSVRVALSAPGQLPPTGNTNGDVDFANRKWHWRQEIVASQVAGILRIDVKVRPKDVGATSDDDNTNWYVTVSGIVGNSMAPPGSYPWPWINIGSTPVNQGANGGSNTANQLQNGTNGNTPGSNSSGGLGSGNNTGTNGGSGTNNQTPTGPVRQ
ncbi:MAG: type II secretion system minor pseudopilin GspI [Sinobacteraceae bacterium]|nr:type II secretion system minor pseudopilin GspI [Nevskiaceae bacterium]